MIYFSNSLPWYYIWRFLYPGQNTHRQILLSLAIRFKNCKNKKAQKHHYGCCSLHHRCLFAVVSQKSDEAASNISISMIPFAGCFMSLEKTFRSVLCIIKSFNWSEKIAFIHGDMHQDTFANLALFDGKDMD